MIALGVWPERPSACSNNASADAVSRCSSSSANCATHVAVEATGSYSKPGFNLLEGQLIVWVVNPAHINAIPGQKTDAHVSSS